ncbi:MAG TPA: hypothetical protein PK264_17885 [Hyphomicrobiaceae bacterium]|nr:hypothetical protein [Hyphomicrobiaceae bacterium]
MTSNTLEIPLKAAAALTGAFGIIIALAAYPATSAPARMLVDLVFWPLDGAPDLAAPAARLLAAIAGGVLVGWAVTLWLLVASLSAKRPDVVGSIVKAGIGSWFLVDSAGSIAAGAPINAFLNIGFLVAFLLPVRLARSAGPLAARHD